MARLKDSASAWEPRRSPFGTGGVAAGWVAALVLCSWAGGAVSSEAPPPPQPSKAAPDAADKPGLDQITVEARRERALLEHQVSSFVSAISAAPFQEALARWKTPICPAVAGLPRGHGEFVLTRISKIATDSGVPLAPENCRGNFYVVVTADPDALLKAWIKRDISIFGDAGGTKIRAFLNSSRPVRVWYNADLNTADGLPLTGYDGTAGAPAAPAMGGGVLQGVPNNDHALGFRLKRDEVRDLSSVIVLIDSRRARGVSFGQLADYVALIGLAELRLDANVGEAPTILHLFSESDKAPPGLSPWDEYFLKALYHTEQTDVMQLSEIKISIVRDVLH
ncbi:MAG: hypothetical protein WA803_05365 [Steroidobacteraceae bacterium]